MPAQDDISRFFLSWRRHLARIVSRIVPPHDVEDIVQETYVRACQFSARSPIRSPGTFMTKTARNLALDYIKRAEWRLTSPLDDDLDTHSGELHSASDQPFQRVASGEEFAHFCEAVRQLPVQCRKVFVLRKVYGYSQQEIARELNLGENAVEKLIGQGTKHCAYYMRQRQDAGGAPAQARHAKVSRFKQGGRS